MNPRISVWLSLVDETLQSQKKPAFQASEFDWLGTLPLDDLLDLLEAADDREPTFDAPWADHWRIFFDRLARRPSAALGENQIDRLLELAKKYFDHFDELPDSFAAARLRLLCWLATFDAAPILELVADQLIESPPVIPEDASLTLSSLFRARRNYPVDVLFPRLLAAIGAPSMSALVLDLGNFLMRHRRVELHPARPLHEPIKRLLADVITRLELLEESPAIDPAEPNARAAASSRMEQINEGVTLAISLCDALAWIGDRGAIQPLLRASELAHRRLRTEAASALARLEEPRGLEILAELAAEPVVRLRALAYLRELGAEEKADEQYRTKEALAQAEMVVHLAEPTQFGLPPLECELLDHKTQFWPGYDNPIECFLFHYRYRAGASTYANVGIVGPLTRSVVADLSDLPAADIYAFYAGWHAEHEDIKEVSAQEAHRAFPADVARLQKKARSAGLEDLEIQKLGLFFGDKILVATATRNAAPGAAIIDDGSISFYPYAGKRAPLGPDEAYDLFKGRRLLANFNR